MAGTVCSGGVGEFSYNWTEHRFKVLRKLRSTQLPGYRFNPTEEALSLKTDKTSHQNNRAHYARILGRLNIHCTCTCTELSYAYHVHVTHHNDLVRRLCLLMFRLPHKLMQQPLERGTFLCDVIGVELSLPTRWTFVCCLHYFRCLTVNFQLGNQHFAEECQVLEDLKHTRICIKNNDRW